VRYRPGICPVVFRPPRRKPTTGACEALDRLGVDPLAQRGGG
jgi:hypothetical protein